MSLFGQPAQGQQTQGSSLSGNAAQKPNLFGSLNTTTTTSQPPQGGLFASLNPNNATSQPQTSGGLFGNLGGHSVTASQPQQAGGLFGSTASQPQQGGGLFASLNVNTAASQPQQSGGLFGSSSQPVQTGGLFGSSSAPKPGGIFANTQTQSQTGGGLFGSSQPAKPGGLFGATQPQQQSGGLFGASQTQQPAQGSGLFGGFGASMNQQLQQQQPQQGLGQSQNQSRLFNAADFAPRQKPVIEQIELAFSKWHPNSPNTPFKAYLYNSVPLENVPFYGPGPADDEVKWEEALAKRPIPATIPVLARGFEQLGRRMVMQMESLTLLRGRLHEINDGLNVCLQKHDLQIAARAVECRRKHQRLAKQCLSLAAKTQILRNRGFTMDSAEEALRQKLMTLERGVFDPALNGQSEEIWARMLIVRERSQQLQRELERAGISQQEAPVLDEAVVKKAGKILEDYGSQLSHLSKEVTQIQKDWADWETNKANAGAQRS